MKKETKTFYVPPKFKEVKIKAYGFMKISDVTNPFGGEEEEW